MNKAQLQPSVIAKAQLAPLAEFSDYWDTWIKMQIQEMAEFSVVTEDKNFQFMCVEFIQGQFDDEVCDLLPYRISQNYFI